MELFKNFVGNVVKSMPTVTKVAYINCYIKEYLRDLERDEVFSHKFTKILKMFLRKEITLDNMCSIIDATGANLKREQIDYFCKRVYDNTHAIDLLYKFIDYNYLDDNDIEYVSEFMVNEINNALING
ncbi:ac75 [Lambdina fiscellaria nucleopolyhedrovirus]|uniref:Ac75 n=1 Tax=Lambdina fiscellaria nucleopolyhedrovirus TaxID=1642929 RepID=A0A0E3Z626_9ABAC|nr:ac75 [Lambdina fiscellaria nucleopolyhedrovirus]AKC91696.1 ac75 [Lambdina fiscellaria nucleopolyhedrovirus]